LSLLAKALSIAMAASSMLGEGMATAMPQTDVEGTLFLVNRQYMIVEDYVPDLRAANVKGSVRNMRPDAAEALEEMFQAAKKDAGHTLVSVSGYRSFRTQSNVYSRKLKNTGSKEKANEYVALPGASEHQLGLAMDLGTTTSTGLTPAFGNSKAGKWVAANAWKYGFIVRYQEGWEDITGYKAEPWHVRFIGKEHAKRVFEQNIPLENYLQALQISTLIDIIR
jgi:D-alanyl-D-alanine carboxypeptidase